MRLACLAIALSLVAGGALAQTTNNTDMALIFAADQADRQASVGTIDWQAVGPRDDARRAETAKLLDDDKLKTADDFHAAAFVFQHGHSPDDYLLAHTLALVAVSKGRAESMWIATATLDRYLGAIGQPQIYGTQYSRPKSTGVWSQEPFNRTLISDGLRKALGVRTLPEQAEQMAKLPTAPPEKKTP